MKTFEQIQAVGLRVTATWYRAAIAAEILGDAEEAAEAWDRYAASLGAVLTLSALAAKSAAYKIASQQGAKWEEEELPEELPDKFDSSEIPWSTSFRPGTFWAAVRGFARRTPLSYLQVKKIRRQMERLALRIKTTESRKAVREMTERLDALKQVLDGSFTVKGASKKQAERIKKLVAEAIRTSAMPKGLKTGSLSSFIRRAQVEGIVGMTGARLQTVYRTNIASAYNDATVETVDKPEVARWAPLLRLVEIHDPRTRGAPGGVYRGNKSRNPGSHWQMNGYIATPADFRRQGIVPPNGFNCRGSLRPVSYDEAESMGLRTKAGTLDYAALARYNAARQRIIDRGEYPDPGFKR